MKNFEELSPKIRMIIIILLSLLLAGLDPLFGQNPEQSSSKTKYPLGYTLSFEPGIDKKAYILYEGTGFKSSKVVDSLYIELTNLSYEDFLPQDILNRIIANVYSYSNGNEIFVYLDSIEVRNQENWPQVDRLTSKYYGKLIKNTISLRKETTQEFLKKGWTSPIITFSWMGIFFILLLVFQIWIIKNWEDLEFSYFFILFILLGLASMPWMLRTNNLVADKVGYYLYIKIWLCILAFASLVTIIYSIVLKKHNKKLGLN